MVADKFPNLKYLGIYLGGDYEAFSPAYDYLSLVSFLDASSALDTFILTVKLLFTLQFHFFLKKEVFI